MAELVLYTNPMSRGRIARWMLEEVGQPYRAEVLGFGEAMKAPGYRSINPMGKVPAVRHGEVVVTEAAAICAYLADAFPEAGLAPAAGHPDRAAYYRWMFFAAGPVEAAVTDRALSHIVPPERTSMVGYGSYGAVMDTLESWLSGHDYVTGERFTAADVYVGSAVGWGLQFGTFERRPAFEAYAARLRERPAMQRAHAIDDALLAEQAAAKSRQGS